MLKLSRPWKQDGLWTAGLCRRFTSTLAQPSFLAHVQYQRFIASLQWNVAVVITAPPKFQRLLSCDLSPKVCDAYSDWKRR